MGGRTRHNPRQVRRLAHPLTIIAALKRACGAASPTATACAGMASRAGRGLIHIDEVGDSRL